MTDKQPRSFRAYLEVYNENDQRVASITTRQSTDALAFLKKQNKDHMVEILTSGFDATLYTEPVHSVIKWLTEQEKISHYETHVVYLNGEKKRLN